MILKIVIAIIIFCVVAYVWIIFEIKKSISYYDKKENELGVAMKNKS
jgi:hypothetical protein